MNLLNRWTLALAMVAAFSMPLSASAKSKEKVQPDWITVEDTASGTFFYDINSLDLEPKNVAPSKLVLAKVNTKVQIKDKNFMKMLGEENKKYNGPDSPLDHITLEMAVNLEDKTYNCYKLEMWNNKDKVIEKKKIKSKFLPIPKNTFVSRIYDRLITLKETQVLEEDPTSIASNGHAN